MLIVNPFHTMCLPHAAHIGSVVDLEAPEDKKLSNLKVPEDKKLSNLEARACVDTGSSVVDKATL